MSTRTTKAPTVDQIRAAIGQCRDEIEALDTAAVPKSEQLSLLKTWIDAQATEFEHQARTAVLTPLSLWPPSPGRIGVGRVRVVGAQSGQSVAETDMTGILCWLLKDTMTEKLTALVESGNTEADGLPTAARPAARADLEAKLDRLEAREEILIRAAEDAGQTITRRADAKPAIILLLDEHLELEASL